MRNQGLPYLGLSAGVVLAVILCGQRARTFAQSRNANEIERSASLPDILEADRRKIETFSLLAFGKIREQPVRIEVENRRSEEVRVPFLSGQLESRSVRRVVVTGVRIALDVDGVVFEEDKQRDFEMWVDDASDSIIRVASRWPDNTLPAMPEPPPDVAVAQMERAGDEKYHGFVDGKPKMSFLEAVAAVKRDGIDPFGAAQIIGEYVIWSRIGFSPRPVWAVTLRGIPFQGTTGNTKERGVRDSVMRYIVDPEERRWICAGNTPHAEASEPVMDSSPK